MTKAHAIQFGKTLLRAAKLASFATVCVVLTGLLEQSREPTALERIQAKGEIRMISRNGPTTYYEGAEGYTGFEYAIANAFARHLGVKLRIVEEEDLGMMINAVGSEIGDFAAAGLSITEQRLHKVQFSPAYFEVTQKLIYRAGDVQPKSVEDLYGKRLVVIGNSSHSENLIRLKRDYPGLEWEERYDLEMMDLLEMVHNGEVDHTIVDSNAYEINNTLFPKAREAFDISGTEQVAWAFPKMKDESLMREVKAFFAREQTQRLIADAKEEFYGHVGKLDYAGSIVFTGRLDSRLPKWRDMLEAAAVESNLDWQLLAALSYQESHWNPRAVSYTGVKGFMMLTLPTAKEMGVKNRLNAEQSIFGGARYFRSIYDRIPERISEPDRTWLALAAYNIGLGHVEDARILTEHHGGDPDKWQDVRENLLLLSKRKYYKFTRHGYARGWEAVSYVQNIRNFYSIIAWNEKNRAQRVAQTYVEPDYAEFSPVVAEAVKTIAAPTIEL